MFLSESVMPDTAQPMHRVATMSPQAQPETARHKHGYDNRRRAEGLGIRGEPFPMYRRGQPSFRKYQVVGNSTVS